MEPGSKYEDLITRYLLKEATPEEEGLVMDWMKADEQNKLYVEEMGRTLQLIELKQDIDQVDVHDEWKKFQNQALGKQQVDIATGTPEWEIIDEQKRKQRAKILRIVFATAAAAVVILLIGIGSGLFTKHSQQENPIPQQAQTPEAGNKIDPLMAVVQHEINTSGKIKKFITPDGSEITLFDSSEITYKEPVEGSKRDVYLVGKAEFKVAKNKAKPFTVYSGDISTTAIGTIFTVTARQNDKFIRVKLDEGKVVVKSTVANNHKWTKDFYMKPGEELTYDKSKQTAIVQSRVEKKMNNSVSDQLVDSPTIPNYDKGSWFMFNNQSLSEVFDALAAMYDVRIVYSKEDIKNMYFIGTYEKSDSIERILNEIALLNKLQVSKLDGGFKIERKALKK